MPSDPTPATVVGKVTPQERWPVGSVWGYGPKCSIPKTTPIRRKVRGYAKGMIWHTEEDAKFGDFMYGEPPEQFGDWCVKADAQRLDTGDAAGGGQA